MKKKVTAALLFAATGFAYAQSSVTLYGIVDTGIQYYNNAAAGGSVVGMPSLTGEVPSRFGIRGVEDLGAASRPFSCLRTVLH
jgi:predicted porin